MANRVKRFTEHTRSFRFKKGIDKELELFCLKNELNISTVIQSAVECFLKHKDCIAHKEVLRATK